MSQFPSESSEEPQNEWAFIASQLRKPEGDFAAQIAIEMNKANESLYNLLVSNLRLFPGSRVLEIGFGNGKWMDKLFQLQPNLTMAGLDYSEEMVNEASTYQNERIKNNQLKLHWGNSSGMPFQAAQFDHIFCINVVYFWEDPVAHLKEIFRVLKPGGTFLPVIRSRKSMMNFPFTQFGFHLREKEDWKQIIVSSGFQLLHLWEKTEIYASPIGEMELENICFEFQKPL